MSSNSAKSNLPQASDKKAKQEIITSRSLKLLEYLKTAFKGAVTTFSYAKIEQTFSELAKAYPDEFKKVYEEAVTEWKSNFNKEIQDIFKRHDVANKLAKIDRCIKTQTPVSKFPENPFINPNTNKRARTLLELDPVSVLKAAKIDVLRKEILDIKNKRKKVVNSSLQITYI
ncbi:hypothetical protein DSO57_1019574 [Entomophthora muscae]|uniref:Uncharacterized protein n=1 Tax=Entomophthora muscae TaxID=34485 RepID=A0ACC2TR60_9FUNG|nr:hypothetical protein DSO57_1019574 [Entomophthora muscae]